MWSLRRPRPAGERQRQEDEETADDILQPPASAAQQEVSEDAVPRPPGASGAGRQFRPDANSGKLEFCFSRGPYSLLDVEDERKRVLGWFKVKDQLPNMWCIPEFDYENDAVYMKRI